ncbi:MAG: hypothetical protein KGZ92_06055 [Firmicutes bacterium]|nr:hypothetical protein [Dethiobacter sp.]MBS3888852.1 hypothetical protein [Bacillota bacterium]MBS4054943.1 hypothetical protein [Thermaerobacter sp.]
MWEDYEEARADKPYTWVVFIFILLFLSSIFIFRPQIGPRNTNAVPQTTQAAVVSMLNEVSHGRPLLARETATGMWAVHSTAPQGRQLVRYLNAHGDELWAETVMFTDSSMAVQGNFLAIAGIGQPRIFVYHIRHKLVSAITAPGEVQAVSVNEQGEVLAVFTVAAAEPLAIRTEVAKYSSQGQQMWRQSLHNELPLLAAQSADGAVNAVLNLTFGQEVGTVLNVLGRHGETLFKAEIMGQPLSLMVQPDGERVVVGTQRSIVSFTKTGHKQFAYQTPGNLSALQFVGTGPHLAFAFDRRSFLDFSLQSTVAVLEENGRQLWQSRQRERVLFISAARESHDIVIGTAQSIMVYSQGGQQSLTVEHAFGANYKGVAVGANQYFLLNGDGQVVQVRPEGK